MKQLIKKIALFLAYCIFAGYSSWMTATSVQLKWMSQMHILFVFVMVFIIALFAGWCLTNVIKELKNSINPSKSRFFINLLGFLLFWTFSFMTNVHYNVIQEYGKNNLNAQLADCKRYLIANSDEALAQVEKDRDIAIKSFTDKIFKLRQQFVGELLNELSGGELVGFGPSAKSILQEIESIINKSANIYDDNTGYISYLYNGERDDAYSRYHSRKDVNEIVKPFFTDRIDEAESKHKAAIVAYFQKQINVIRDNKEYLNTVAWYENELKKMEANGSSDYSEYYRFYKSMDENLLSKVDGYKNSNLIYVKDKEGKEVFKGYKIYPSDRLFNFWNVWKDWFKGELPEHMSLAGQFIWAGIVDVIAFILISLI